MFSAAILAAGEGTRFQMHGVATPKPLVPIGGVPMITRLARQLSEVGASDIACILNPRAAEHGAEQALLAGAGAVPVRVVVQATASSFHSLCEVLPLLAGRPFLLGLVDTVCDTAELGRFVSHATRTEGVDAHVAVTEFVHDEAPLYVHVDAGSRVVGFGETGSGHPLVTGGLYWFTPRVADLAAEARTAGIARLRNFLSFLLPRGAAILAYHFTRIVDVDTPQDLVFVDNALARTTDGQ